MCIFNIFGRCVARFFFTVSRCSIAVVCQILKIHASPIEFAFCLIISELIPLNRIHLYSNLLRQSSILLRGQKNRQRKKFHTKKPCFFTLLLVRGCGGTKSSFDFRRLSFRIIRAAAKAIVIDCLRFFS